MYESFKYIHAPSYEHNKFDVIESKYKSVDDLSGKFVAYATGIGYRIFNDITNFCIYLNSIEPVDRVFHEVIFNQAQKLKFDIDATVDKIDCFEIPKQDVDEYDQPVVIPNVEIDSEISAFLDEFQIDETSATTSDPEDIRSSKYKNIFDTILQTIKDTFFITYGADLKDSQIIICESKDTSSQIRKYSNHIIIDNYYVTGPQQAKEFTRRLGMYLPDQYRKFLDMSVNKQIQNFRIVGCHKSDDNRVKTIITGQHHLRSFITEISDCEPLLDISVREANLRNFRIDMHPDDVNKVLSICRANGIFNDNKFKFVRNGVFIFSRQRPSHCEFCSRTHDSDNTVIVTAQNNDGVITVFKQCRKYIDEHHDSGAVSIGEFISNVAPIEVANETDQRINERKISCWVDKTIVKSVSDLKSGNDLFPTRLLFDDLAPVRKHVYSEPILLPFELTKTLVVHAMMKMGKTKALLDYIKKYFSNGLREPIIRFVSFRQTFSGNIKEKFADFTLYSDIKGPLNQTKLIVQVESLWRLDIQEGADAPDLLILDECESIFEQFDSGLLRNFTDCFSKFQYLLKYSKHVICMDANISDRTFRVLKQMRPEFVNAVNEIAYHCNRYRNATSDNYFITGDKLKWLGLLYSTIEADERIAVPMSSLTEAKVLVKNLTKRYPQKQVKLYSSETTMSEKREHFADVNTHWLQYDILVYTPTVSAGVSFEQKHFHKVFGYFTDQSCPVETCIQMIGRIRDVRDLKFYICLCATGNNLPTDIDSIKQYVFNKRENLIKNFDETGLIPEYGPIGDIRYHMSDYFHLWLENARIKNLSKNSFIRRFIHLVSFSGANVEYLSDTAFEEFTGIQTKIDGKINSDLLELKEAHSIARSEIREELCLKIANANEINDEEVDEIHKMMVAQQDIPEERKYAFEKHRLRVDYHYIGNIDEKFVAKYRDPKVRRMFKNIVRISSCENTDEALKQIQCEEAANYHYIMELGEKYQHQDLNRKYVFDQHRYALGLLKLCGWKNINDPQFIHKIVLAKNLRACNNIYLEVIKPACAEFQIRAPSLQSILVNQNNDDTYVKIMLKPINKILSLMYGIQIVSKKIDPDMYYISHNSLFTLNPTESKDKNMPLILPVQKTQAEGFDECI